MDFVVGPPVVRSQRLPPQNPNTPESKARTQIMILYKVLDSYFLFEDPIMVATSANATRFSARNRKSEREFAHTKTDWSPHGGNPAGFAQEVVQPQSPSGGTEFEGFFLPLRGCFSPRSRLVGTQQAATSRDTTKPRSVQLGAYSLRALFEQPSAQRRTEGESYGR